MAVWRTSLPRGVSLQKAVTSRAGMSALQVAFRPARRWMYAEMGLVRPQTRYCTPIPPEKVL